MSRWSSRVAVTAAVAFGVGLATAGEAQEVLPPIEGDWPHEGLLGAFDYAAAQRGFKVYREVCETCHGLEYLAFRNLEDIGFGEDQVRAIAAEYEVADEPDETGEVSQREALPSDRMPPPYPNEQAARAANGGALPPDLSLIVKARENGTDYVYSLLRGYEDPPADAEPRPGMHYNLYFADNWIAMPPPLQPDIVSYDDGTSATVEQMSSDVTTFLAWVAEPTLEERKGLGLRVMLFLVVLTGLLYATKRRIWSDIH